MCFPITFGGQRHARADRQPMPQGTSGNIDAGDAKMRNMSGERRAALIERLQPLQRKELAFSQYSIETRAPMAFAEHKTIAVGPIRARRIGSQHLAVKNGK